MIDKLRVAGVMKIDSERSEVFMLHDAGHDEFTKPILLLFSFSQRPSSTCDPQKQESVVTSLN